MEIPQESALPARQTRNISSCSERENPLLSRPGRIAGVVRRAINSFDLKDEQFKVVAKPPHVTVIRSNYHLADIQGCPAAPIAKVLQRLIRDWGQNLDHGCQVAKEGNF
ncbi:hypothetical protein L1887_20511 [Cichorium endivia]|nr:hypothetical protein L1887_20511 [Cichorium endivia]